MDRWGSTPPNGEAAGCVSVAGRPQCLESELRGDCALYRVRYQGVLAFSSFPGLIVSVEISPRRETLSGFGVLSCLKAGYSE